MGLLYNIWDWSYYLIYHILFDVIIDNLIIILAVFALIMIWWLIANRHKES